MSDAFDVEIVYAALDAVHRCTIRAVSGSTVEEALRQAGVLEAWFLDRASLRVGIFGRRVTSATILSDGDRIEIYRPLRMDPKEARRRRAKKRMLRTSVA